MRDLNFRRKSEKLHLKHRKMIVNSIKDWNLNDEQVKVEMECPVSIYSNSNWIINQKQKRSRKDRRENKIKLKKILEY